MICMNGIRVSCTGIHPLISAHSGCLVLFPSITTIFLFAYAFAPPCATQFVSKICAKYARPWKRGWVGYPISHHLYTFVTKYYDIFNKAPFFNFYKNFALLRVQIFWRSKNIYPSLLFWWVFPEKLLNMRNG